MWACLATINPFSQIEREKNANEIITAQTLNSDELFPSTYCNEYSTRSIEVVNPALKEKPADIE